MREKNEQVGRMKQIYQEADKVIVLLGEQSDDSDCAIEFIDELDGLKMNKKKRQLRRDLSDDRYDAKWAALNNFFLRGWWTRIWTIQEFMLAKGISFWCGTQNLDRSAIFGALFVADKCNAPGFKGSLAFHHAWNRRRTRMICEAVPNSDEVMPNSDEVMPNSDEVMPNSDEVMPNSDEAVRKPGKLFSLSLLALAAYFCSNEAKDDHDRLYGLMGLSTENHGLEPNYSRTVNEVYLDFAQSFIAQHKSLDIIIFASLFIATSESSLPSWVPDWRTRIKPFVVPLMVSQSSHRQDSSTFVGNFRPWEYHVYDEKSTQYSASGSRAAVYGFKGSTLHVQGYVVDAVDGLVGLRDCGFTQSLGQHTRRSDAVYLPKDILTSVCRSLVVDREDRYLQYAMPEERFYHDFVHLCLHLLFGSQFRVDGDTREFQRWFESSRDLQIHGRRFEDILRDLEHNSTNRSPLNLDEEKQKSFYNRFYDTVTRMSLRLMTSHNGRIGMVQQRAMKGDLVCVLLGCSVPVLLRRSEHEDRFTLIGECFLEQCMNGEALEHSDVEERTFRII
jgi:hypothetical protein